MGFSELLYEKSNNKEFTRTGEYASIIYSSSRNAMDLLHNLTGWTKLQTGKINFNPRETDLANLIDDAVEFAKPAALIKSINIEVNASTGLTLKVDREMLGTILRNLVMNAIKFSYKASKITISSGKTDGMAFIEISDSGIGMDKQAISGILNSNAIESTPGTENEKGTGLGLYICREFIAFHDGELQIISEPGKGSRFIVRLPETAPES
jgi:signal transduction histidine kinase